MAWFVRIEKQEFREDNRARIMRVDLFGWSPLPVPGVKRPTPCTQLARVSGCLDTRRARMSCDGVCCRHNKVCSLAVRKETKEILPVLLCIIRILFGSKKKCMVSFVLLPLFVWFAQNFLVYHPTPNKIRRVPCGRRELDRISSAKDAWYVVRIFWWLKTIFCGAVTAQNIILILFSDKQHAWLRHETGDRDTSCFNHQLS